ncbi:hypothetical protein SAMN04488129_12324 [Halomonas daqiaonensis]|uniref:Uncharacterized protein n=1 Tax=Halomonas daqiaonensis TaxID=650850 RepID=A0A1H7V719_9GAMM|nr:hypothetical protein SAMN04488129_12324 [Halomonas daqiaonensis]
MSGGSCGSTSCRARVGLNYAMLALTLGIVYEVTEQRRNRIYANRVYIDILNQDTP